MKFSASSSKTLASAFPSISPTKGCEVLPGRMLRVFLPNWAKATPGTKNSSVRLGGSPLMKHVRSATRTCTRRRSTFRAISAGEELKTHGEDPYLVSRLGVEMAKAMQRNNQIASTAKHFAVYSIAKGAREGQARTDPQATLHEVEN